MKTTLVRFSLILAALVAAGLTWWKTNPTTAFAVLAGLCVLAFVYGKIASWGDLATGDRPDPIGVAHREQMQRDAKAKQEVEP